MCLAIYKPARAVIPTEHLFNGYEYNSNGCGFAYSEKGKLHIVKGLFSFPEFLKLYKEKEQFPMLIHFRWATHGDTNTLNCHPFSILDGKFALIHNGVLPIHLTIKKLSDTGNFAKLVMEPMLQNGVHPNKPAFRFLVEQSIGHGNRIALMAANGTVVIYNGDDGVTEDAVDKNGKQITFKVKEGDKIEEFVDQVWYSNDCYKATIRRRRVTHQEAQDEYAGYFDGAASASDMTTSVGEGFVGTPKTETNTNFCNKPKLDSPPMGIVLGFKDGVKNAEFSASAIQEAYKNGVPQIEERNEKPRLMLPSPKTEILAHTITPIDKGPMFKAKDELEIHLLMSESGMSREKVIEILGLEIEDAITFIE